MKLAARTALYFHYCVAARFRLSPVPTSAKEVAFVARAFAKVAPVEYFAMQTPKDASPSPFKPYLSVVVSAFDQLSQSDPFNGAAAGVSQTSAQLQHRQGELAAYLRTICGLPRYSYVENDHFYMDGSARVAFKHTLKPEARGLDGRYAIADSTAARPFFTMSGPAAPEQVLPAVRHNFQKIHKMELLSLDVGTPALRAIAGAHLGSVHVDADTAVDVAALVDFAQSVPMKHTHQTKRR